MAGRWQREACTHLTKDTPRYHGRTETATHGVATHSPSRRHQPVPIQKPRKTSQNPATARNSTPQTSGRRRSHSEMPSVRLHGARPNQRCSREPRTRTRHLYTAPVGPKCSRPPLDSQAAPTDSVNRVAERAGRIHSSMEQRPTEKGSKWGVMEGNAGQEEGNFMKRAIYK